MLFTFTIEALVYVQIIIVHRKFCFCLKFVVVCDWWKCFNGKNISIYALCWCTLCCIMLMHLSAHYVDNAGKILLNFSFQLGVFFKLCFDSNQLPTVSITSYKSWNGLPTRQLLISLVCVYHVLYLTNTRHTCKPSLKPVCCRQWCWLYLASPGSSARSMPSY